MAEGIEFHNGADKLELNLGVLDDALVYDDHLEHWMKSQKHQQWFSHEFMKDVNYFEDRVHEVTDGYYEESTGSILDYILCKEGTSLELIRTALVHCNFSDVSRLIRDLTSRLEKCKGDTVVITDSDEIHTIFDRIKSSKGQCSMIVQQFESLKPTFLDSLITLIRSDWVVRQAISNMKLIVCVSTGSGYFNSCCTTESLDSLLVKNFKFVESEEIFEKILSIDISPAVYSGRFTNYLRSRYFDCDFSVDAVVKAIKFAFLMKYVDNPLWKKKGDNSEQIEKYYRVLRIFKNSLGKIKPMDKNKLHLDLQTNENFWKDFLEDRHFKEWQHMMLEERNSDAFSEFVGSVQSEIEPIDEDLYAQIEYGIERLQKLADIGEEVSPTKEAATPKKKMNLNEFRKQQSMTFNAKIDNPVRNNKNGVIDLVMKSLEKLLGRWPAGWENVLDCQVDLLDANHEKHLEKVLLLDQSNELVSIGWKSLLAQKGWKSVGMADWANGFLQQTTEMVEESDAQSAFFATAGHLELLGIIKPTADRKHVNVGVLYHPITCVPLI